MKREIIIRPEPAPLNKRAFAYVLDWYLGSAFSSIPVGILWNMRTGETAINTDLLLFENSYGLLAGLLGILFGAIYFYAVPQLIWKGQTLGKRLMRIRIAGEDGGTLSAGRMALRQIVGVMLLEGAFMLTGNYFTQMISIVAFDMVGKLFNYIIFAVFIISACLIWKDRTAIHDMLVHSIVIENKKN